MLQKGCKGFLTHVKEVIENKSGLRLVPVIREFLDVFPKVQPRLPPEKEIDFKIDLVPSTRPISIPPYRMVPAKLIKEQL